MAKIKFLMDCVNQNKIGTTRKLSGKNMFQN